VFVVVERFNHREAVMDKRIISVELTEEQWNDVCMALTDSASKWLERAIEETVDNSTFRVRMSIVEDIHNIREQIKSTIYGAKA
jgi:hypothetical protein